MRSLQHIDRLQLLILLNSTTTVSHVIFAVVNVTLLKHSGQLNLNLDSFGTSHILNQAIASNVGGNPGVEVL